MFILEGADYVGKSTVAQRLSNLIKRRRWARKYGATINEVQHWGKLPEGFDYCESYLAAAQPERAQLCDRFVLSELAYGEVYRGGASPKFTSHRRRLVARELNRAGSVQLLVWANWPSVARRMSERSDEFLRGEEHYHQLYRAYGLALKDLALGRPGISYLGELDCSDGREEELNAALGWMLDLWDQHLERARLIAELAPEAWGYLWPRVIFVGERVGGDGAGTRPFAERDRAGCSAFFSDLLDAAEVPERWLFLVNAYDRAGSPLDVAIFRALRPKLVIALGKAAAKYCRERAVDHAEFPHPQWIKRFEARRFDSWVKSLRTLLEPLRSSAASDATSCSPVG